MRKLLSILLALSLLISCNNKKEVKSDKEIADQKTVTPAVSLLQKMIGSFVGAFGDNKITLLITKAKGDTVEGRSIVGGNDRPFIGTLIKQEGWYEVTAREPGDDPNDGIFSFSIRESAPDVISGSWKPNNEKKPAKDYTLQRKEFKYLADAGQYPETSKRLLVATDVENMMKPDLEYMRNEIFARHGFCFKKKDMRQMFELQEWYVPDNTDIRGRLTDIEKKNIELIKRYEKYAQDYGDEYGR